MAGPAPDTRPPGGRANRVAAMAAGAFALAAAVGVPAHAESGTGASWLPSLETDTPEQGFALAVTLARQAVKMAQPDVGTLQELCHSYAQDADSLIAVSRTVAAYFATVAQANGYWRDTD